MLDSFADMRFESSGATQVDTYPSACTSTSTGNNSNTNSISNCSSLNSSVSRPLPKTFTRLARGLPTNSTNDFLSNTTLFQPFPPAHSKPTEADSVARKDPDQSENISTRANNDTGANATSTFRDDSASSNSFTDNSKSSYHTKANTHGLQRFRPTLPSLDSYQALSNFYQNLKVA
ncbi:hypothetical protein EDD11_006448 [Mortierella claussenii]|nr:hypothetical protein EDD11_006448 [Mortierella claussenii]